jgi:hypothetical protein
MRRTVAPPALDRDCSDKRNNYVSVARYNSFLKPQIQQYVDAIREITGDNIESMKASRDPVQTQQYNTVLQNLQLAETAVNGHIQCINKDIIQRNDYASRLYNLQQEIENLRKEVKEKKETWSEAKERSNQLENPYEKTTWWETWFPLGRPIRKENVPVLLSVSIVMLVLSLGVFLRYAGFELRLDSIQTSTNSFLKQINSGKYPQRV